MDLKFPPVLELENLQHFGVAVCAGSLTTGVRGATPANLVQ